MSIPSPNQVPAAVETGGSQWFTQEVHPHDGQLKAYLRGAFPTVRDVEDVVQESYVRIWKARAGRPIQSAKAFLFSIARHVALDVLRKKRRSPIDALGDLSELDVIDNRPTAVESLNTREKLDLLAEAIAALPARCREVILLHKIDGLSQKEVADRLRISPRTVENHCRAGAKLCEDYLRDRGVVGFRCE